MPEYKKIQKEKIDELQVVVFRLKDEEFGVDITKVKEILKIGEITHVPKAPNFIKGVINLRGQIVALIDLAQQFQIETQNKIDSNKARIVVVEILDQTVGILVDEVPEVIRIKQDDIKPTPEIVKTKVRTDYIKGVGKIADRLLILLDIEKVLASHEIEKVAEVTKEI
jgi:purine-binding chemotaxis protein CheW